MKVEDLMTSNVKACGPESSLAEVAELLWENDCGVLPVIDQTGRVEGAITDRDIAIAVCTKDRLASDIKVGEVMTREVLTVTRDEDIKSALKKMGEARVRRLPVVEDGLLCGILSMNDVVLRAGRSQTDYSNDDIVKTFKAICQHNITRAAVR